MAVAEVKTVMVLSGLDAEWHEVVRPRLLDPPVAPEIAQLMQLTLPPNQSCGRFKVIRSLTPALSDDTLAFCPFFTPFTSLLRTSRVLCDSCLQYLLLLVGPPMIFVLSN